MANAEKWLHFQGSIKGCEMKCKGRRRGTEGQRENEAKKKVPDITNSEELSIKRAVLLSRTSTPMAGLGEERGGGGREVWSHQEPM